MMMMMMMLVGQNSLAGAVLPTDQETLHIDARELRASNHTHAGAQRTA
jgi:hypothetical protein